jgi:hypothetical protein
MSNKEKPSLQEAIICNGRRQELDVYLPASIGQCLQNKDLRLIFIRSGKLVRGI